MAPARTLALSLLALAAASPAAADRREPPVHFEMGLNTRRFEASEGKRVAFRTVSGGALDDATAGGTGVTVSLRFTKWTRWNTFAGVEAETGTLVTPGSNFAGAYGLVGARGAVGPVALRVELAPGKRWIRYDANPKNLETYMIESRVRAETWLSSRFTLGGAIGSTLTGDIRVWMAGVYIGVHSLDFGTR